MAGASFFAAEVIWRMFSSRGFVNTTLLVSIESEPYLSEAGKILESKECSTLSKPCLNLDRIMNNAEMMAWIALAEGA